jgi:hypothetical protein
VDISHNLFFSLDVTCQNSAKGLDLILVLFSFSNVSISSLFSGGLFDLAESKQEVAFRYAVDRVNSNRKILPDSSLSAQLEKIPPQDSFHASKRGKNENRRNPKKSEKKKSHLK